MFLLSLTSDFADWSKNKITKNYNPPLNINGTIPKSVNVRFINSGKHDKNNKNAFSHAECCNVRLMMPFSLKEVVKCAKVCLNSL